MRTRRQFLIHSIGAGSAAWLATQWPAVLEAAKHSRAATAAGGATFEFFTPEMAAEVESMTARIIPSGGSSSEPSGQTPGAREAGVVYFIDRALVTFARAEQKLYVDGIADVQARVRTMFAGVERFSAASAGQQDAVLASLDDKRGFTGKPFGIWPAGSFFEMLRQHTVAGFLIDPESERRGNRDGVGWKVVGRENAHMFASPFGFYDKEYPGWSAAADGGGKK